MTFLDQSSEKGGPDKYFLGPIVVLYKLPETVELLDGQQRVATATILFATLRDVARGLNTQAASDFAANIQTRFVQKRDADGEDVGKFSLVLGDLDRSYFLANIQSEGTPTKAKLRTNRNIEFAKQFIREKVSEKLSGLDPKSQLAWLNRLKLAVQRDLVMACIPVASERDAFML
jgi:uncharacterized protein with ParB-like and HNH nuclease domain